MNVLKQIFFLIIFLCTVAILSAGCGGSGSSGGSNGGDDASDSSWDTMVWEQGKWG